MLISDKNEKSSEQIPKDIEQTRKISFNLDDETSLDSLNIDESIQIQPSQEKLNRKNKKKIKILTENKKKYLSGQKILSSIYMAKFNKDIIPSYEKSKMLISLLTSPIQTQVSTRSNYLVIFKLSIDKDDLVRAKVINSKPITGKS